MLQYQQNCKELKRKVRNMNFKKLMSIAMGAAIVSSIMPASSVKAAIQLFICFK